jgi:hypothetical protein
VLAAGDELTTDLTDQQLVLHRLQSLCVIKKSQVEFVAENDSLICDAGSLTLTAENTDIIMEHHAPFRSSILKALLDHLDGSRWTDLRTGSAEDTIILLIFRPAAETLRNHGGLLGKFAGIGPFNNGRDGLF